MSFSGDFYSKFIDKRKKKEEEEKQNSTVSFSDAFYSAMEGEDRVRTTEDIKPLYVNKTAPLYTSSTEGGFGSGRANGRGGSFGGHRSFDPEKANDRTWFQAGALDDGYQFGDIAKTILGTAGDLVHDVGAGVLGIPEAVVDTGASMVGTVGGWFGFDEFEEDVDAWITHDLIDEESASYALLGGWLVDGVLGAGDTNMEDASVLGEKTDSLAQSGGQLLGTVGLQALGVPWWVTTGVTSYGASYEEAIMNGATHDEALMVGAMNAGAEILTEKLFGGSGLGELGLVNLDGLTSNISSKLVKRALDFGIDMTAEGSEEVVSQLFSNFATTIYSEENWKDILFSEEALDGYIESFVGGMALSGVMNAGKVSQSAKTGRDYRTGMNAREKAVFDRVYQQMLAEESQHGTIDSKRKAEIYDEVMLMMEKGYISTDIIEEVLGGEAYQTYRDTIAKEDATIKEFEELYEGDELRQKIAGFMEHSEREQLKNSLTKDMLGIVKGTHLAESYIERGRRGQKFTADLSQYDTKHHATIQRAIDSGILNNTNRTHEFVEMLAKIEADHGITFDFTNNERLKNSGFAVDGKVVNGYITDGGVVLNINSAKALNAVVGHEITHAFEGTELYGKLQEVVFEYAKSKTATDSKFKNEYLERLHNAQQLYGNVEGYKGLNGSEKIKREIVADMVGDYLFTDRNFVSHLATTNRNMFRRAWDRIKYLYDVATAGSKEAKELAKVKKIFEDVYRQKVVAKSIRSTPVQQISSTQETPAAQETAIEQETVSGNNGEYGVIERLLGMKRVSNTFANDIINNEAIAQAFTDLTGVELEGTTEHKRWIIRETVKEWQRLSEENDAIAMAAAEQAEAEYAQEQAEAEKARAEQAIRDSGYRSYIRGLFFRGATFAEAQEIARNPEMRAEWESITGKTLPQNEKSAIKMIRQTKRNPDNISLPQYSISDSDGKQLTAEQQDYTAESEVSFSLSKDTEYMDKAIDANNAYMNIATDVMAEAKAMRGRIAARMNEIKDIGLVALPDDIEGNTYLANSSYDGSEENTTICPRSLASEAFVDAVSEYLGRPLTVEEQIYISQDLQGRTLTPECLYCYVATDRKAYRAFLGDYVAQRDSVLEKIKANPNADTSRSGELYKEFLNGRKDTNPMYNRFKMWVDTYKSGKPMVDASHLANINKLMGDINSEFGEDLKPQIVDAMKYAQSASWAKKRVNYVAYNGHILKWKQDRINKLNSHYGLRMYSFSDFHPAFVLENMQMITDASVRGLKMLGYTKDTDFVEIFAPTGMNINVSTFGFESGGEVFENNLTGADWETAKRLREQYPNVGVTFVATNDNLVNWALAQEWIDVVIPYHLVRTGAEVAKALEYTNYTSESSDTKTAEWKKGDKKYIAPTEHNNDKATYLAALEKNHLKPRFERFLDNPNYMKLVNECRQPASKSKPVQPRFNEDAAMKALAKLEANGYYQPIGGSVDRMYEIAAEVAENMRTALAPAMSLSAEGEAPIRRGFGTYGEDIALAPVADNATAESQMFPDDIAPMPEDEATARDRLASLTDADAPVATDDSPTADTGVYEAITPKQEKQPRMARATPEEQARAEILVDEQSQPEKKGKASPRQELHSRIMDGIREEFRRRGYDFDEVLKNAKNLSTFATVDNIPQRVLEKALGYKEGQVLSDLTMNKVAQNETEGIKWLNSYTDRKSGLLRLLSDQYHIKPGSKESAAAQMYAEGFYVDDNNNIIEYGDAELAKDFPDRQTQVNIKGLASDPRIRTIYDDTLAMINESRTRNAYPEIPRLDNYFLHFRAMDDTFSRLGLPFNPNDIRAKDLPTDLNGVTADLKPGQPFFASAMHRTGKRTSFDLLGGLERYLTSAKNQIYHIDDIQTLRALRNHIADTYGQAHGLEGLDVLSEEEVQDRIEKVYGSHLSTFAKFLNEEANILAGKTALIDRGLEGIIGRRGIQFLNNLNQQVGSNQVGYSVSSPLTNFLPVTQAFAKTNKAAFVKAFAQTTANKVNSIFGRSDGFAEQSPVMIRRKGADRFHRTFWQKLGDPGYALMGAVDNISTELIARTKYNELTSKGMDSQTAHYETDKWVSRLMGDRSLGQMPQLYNSKMLGLITKYQLEVRNQLDSQFYDTIQEAKVSNEHIENALARNAKTAAKVTSTLVQLAVAQHLFGTAFESVAGYNPAFDIIDVVIKMFGWDDEEDSEDTALDNIEEGFLALLEDLPYTSVITNGGRIPISSALPIEQFITGEDEYGNEKSRWETIAETAPYYLMPGGYGQLRKTVQGLSMFSDEHPIAGSYTDSGNLRFPVEDTFGNRVQAALFGQWANENARDYIDNERKPLNEKQVQEYIDVDIPIRDYWEYREGLQGMTKLSEKADYIASLDLPIDKKNILVNNIANREEPIDLTGYENFAGFDEFDFAMNNPEKYEIAQQVGGYEAYMGYQEGMKGMKLAEKVDYIAGLNLTTAQKNALINGETDRKEPIDLTGYDPSLFSSFEEFEYSKSNPDKYAVAKSVGGYEAYRSYMSDLYDIKADKDENGKSISGSRKEKVLEYINNMDADYYTKIILWRSEYPSDDTYNMEIINYLNGRSDISFEEEVAILRGLGFDVSSDGTITW